MDLPARGLGHLGERGAFWAFEQFNQHRLLGAFACCWFGLRSGSKRLHAIGRGLKQIGAVIAALDQLCIEQCVDHLGQCAASEVGRKVGQLFVGMHGSGLEQAALGVCEFHCLTFDACNFFASASPAA